MSLDDDVDVDVDVDEDANAASKRESGSSDGRVVLDVV